RLAVVRRGLEPDFRRPHGDGRSGVRLMATAVRDRPTAPPPPPTSTPQPEMPEPRLSSAIEAGAELAVVLMTAAAGVSLLRLFSDGSFLDRVLLAVVAAHGLAWAARRMRLGLGGATFLSALGLFLFLAYVIEPHTLSA